MQTSRPLYALLIALCFVGAARAQPLSESEGSIWMLGAFDDSQIHCPWHPEHCNILDDIDGENYTVSSNVSFEHNGTSHTPALNVTAGSNATLMINLNQTGSLGHITNNVTVGIGPVLGLNFTLTLNQTVPLNSSAPVTVSFPFEVAPVWPVDDVIFAPVAVGTNDLWVFGFAPVRVVSASSAISPTPLMPPIATPTDDTPVGPLALVALATAALVWSRSRRH